MTEGRRRARGTASSSCGNQMWKQTPWCCSPTPVWAERTQLLGGAYLPVLFKSSMKLFLCSLFSLILSNKHHCSPPPPSVTPSCPLYSSVSLHSSKPALHSELVHVLTSIFNLSSARVLCLCFHRPRWFTNLFLLTETRRTAFTC